VAHLLATGVWTHDHPLQAGDAQALGLPVQIGVPDEERALLRLYPQPRGRESSVEYSPAFPAQPAHPEAPRPRALR
jgi:serine dehydrogenase proteinase